MISMYLTLIEILKLIMIPLGFILMMFKILKYIFPRIVVDSQKLREENIKLEKSFLSLVKILCYKSNDGEEKVINQIKSFRDEYIDHFDYYKYGYILPNCSYLKHLNKLIKWRDIGLSRIDKNRKLFPNAYFKGMWGDDSGNFDKERYLNYTKIIRDMYYKLFGRTRYLKVINIKKDLIKGLEEEFPECKGSIKP